MIYDTPDVSFIRTITTLELEQATLAFGFCLPCGEQSYGLGAVFSFLVL